MKVRTAAAILLILLYSCQKQVVSLNETESFVPQLKTQLQPVLSCYNLISFDTAFVSRMGNEMYVQFPFKGYAADQKFLLLQVSDNGHVIAGRIADIRLKDHGISGTISLQEMNGGYLLRDAVITDGFVEPEQTETTALRPLVLVDGWKTLPLVILVSSKLRPGGASYYYLSTLLGGSGGGASISGYYSSVSAGGGGGSSNPVESNSGGVTKGPGKEASVKDADVILVDFERAESKSAIDISRYLKCFEAIPDVGATCSIEIFADIPVDSDPNKLFDIRSESPGHSFLQIKKSNGTKSVIQNIGFYPVKGWKSLLTLAPVEGKFVDNSLHEFNASFKMNLSADQLTLTLTEMARVVKYVKYDIDEYNCTDFALEIFNVARNSKFSIPKVDIPGAQAPGGTNTPQGIYMKLLEMKKNGHAEAANITLGIVKGYVGNGTGACN